MGEEEEIGEVEEKLKDFRETHLKITGEVYSTRTRKK